MSHQYNKNNIKKPQQIINIQEESEITLNLNLNNKMEEEKKQVFTDKYDRQIRLWGANGQKALKNSNILLLNCEPAGVETFKNLVLPGIGRVSVVDNKNVTQQDLGKNFFVAQSDLGQNRAKAVYNNLLEMNPDVQGEYIDKDPNQVANDESILQKYNLVVASELDDQNLAHLSRHCHQNNIALVIINTYGFIGRLRIQNGVHTIVESKPLQATYYDMKLSKPFAALQQYADSFDIDAINSKITKGVNDGESGKAINQLMHIPYAVLLIKALQQYQAKNDGKTPKTSQEKRSFKTDYLKKMGEKLENAGNFEQAESFAYQAFIPSTQIHSYVNGGAQSIFQHPLFATSQDDFWVLARNLKTFYDKEGTLPTSSNLPDMESSTDNYLELKKVFKEKFESDLQLFKNYLGETKIPDDEIKLFVQQVCYLSVYNYKPYFQELTNPTNLPVDINYTIDSVIVNKGYQWILAIRALNNWLKNNNGQYPVFQKDEQAFLAEMQKISQEALRVDPDSNNGDQLSIDIASEMIRTAQIRLHNIASIFGGVASQEAIKLITHQFQPMNNTYIYDGTISVSQTLEL